MKKIILLLVLTTAMFANNAFFEQKSLFGKSKVLSIEEAFDVKIEKKDSSVTVNFILGEGIYVYDNKIKISIIEPKNIPLHVEKPKPVDHDGFAVHENNFKIVIPIAKVKEYITSGKVKLKIKYQGCASSGICYNPMSSETVLDFGVVSPKEVSKGELSEQDFIANTLKNGSIWLILATFFGFGVLLSLTPCIFPMIPILSSIIVSQSHVNMSTKRAFTLSLVYVLSMSVAYTIAGVLAGLFGANIQAALQAPMIVSLFSLVFVALAFSMFGFFEIQMPSFIQSKLAKKSEEAQGHGLFGVAIMGFLSALIVGPCVAAPLAGALIYIGQSGDALLGGLALFVMSLGMGLPLLAIGTGAGKYMPKPGGWMNTIKSAFGVIMLAIAVWMLSRIINSQVTMFLYSALIISSAVYLGALEPIKEGVSGWLKLLKSFALMFLIFGVVIFVGFLSGATNPLNPLERLLNNSNSSVVVKKSDFQQVKSLKELKNILSSSSKPVMVDFYADWCVSCVELEHYTFSDNQVKEQLKKYKLIQIDVTKNSDDDKKLLKEFALFGPPAIMFFQEGKELKSKRIIGFKDAKVFLGHLKGMK